MKKLFSISLVLCCWIAIAFGHGWLISPTPRIPTTVNTQSPCENKAPTDPPTQTIFINTPFTVTWGNFHAPGGGTCIISIAPIAQSPAASSLKQIASGPYDPGTLQATVPSGTHPGKYTLQWYQTAPGPYWNCADVWIYQSPPTGATLKSGTVYELANGHGTFDASTGKVSCNSGYTAHGTTCKKGLSAGAAFGVFLLVLVLVSLVGFVGVMIFLKLRHPDKYVYVVDKFKAAGTKIKDTSISAKNKVTGHSNNTNTNTNSTNATYGTNV